jgi:rare lipoprotein A
LSLFCFKSLGLGADGNVECFDLFRLRIPVSSMVSGKFLRFSALTGLALLVANCASSPPSQKRNLSAQNQREIGFFSNKAKYGSASPRVVSGNEAVPKGGGRDHVGKPYKVAGKWYTPRDNPNYSSTGMSSWYGDAFHGRKTANGEVYDKHSYTAAHPTMPLPSYARVTNASNGRSIIVRVNDRGPFHGGRIIDVSERVAHALEFKHLGTARVKVDYVSRASTAGSDDRKLVATLRTDGGVAQLPGVSTPSPILVANVEPAISTPRPDFTRYEVERREPARTVAAPAVQSSPVEAEKDTAEVLQVSAPVRRSVPLPPDRPFDLGTIPGAGVPMQRVNNGEGAAPTNRPPISEPSRERIAAIYFAPAVGLSSHFGGDDPLKRLKSGQLKPVVHADQSRKILAGSYRDRANANRIAAVLAKHGTAKITESTSNGSVLFQVTAEQFSSQEAAAKALSATKAAGASDARFFR